MHGFHEDLNLKPLIGWDLNLLCLGKYDIQLHFAGCEIESICIQGDVRLFQSGKLVAEWSEDRNWTTLAFQSLLNLKPTGFSAERKLLKIFFEENFELWIQDLEMYESVQIYWRDGGVEII